MSMENAPKIHTEKDDIYGQYAYDRAVRGDELDDSTGTLDVRGDGNIGFHQESVMFDEADTINPDEATGTAAKNPDELADNDIYEYPQGDKDYGDDIDPNDEASKWLAEHDK